MSYRNPEIIVDRSAEIFAQGMSNLGQTMVQGVQNIYKQREEQNIAIKKQQDAINVFTQNLRGDYNKRISGVASGIKDKSFAEQYIAEQTSSYEDLIKEQARLAFNPGSFSKEQIADLNKRVAEVTSTDAAAKEFATNVTLDLETVQDYVFGQGGSEYVFTGDRKGNGMFKNMIFLYANGNKEIPGIEYEKVYKNKKWEISATINKDNPIIKQLIGSGVVDVNDLKDVDGKTVLNFSGDPKDYTSVLMKVDPGVDIQSAMLESGIVNNKGEINENFFDKEYTSKSSRVPGKDIVTERGVFMEDYIRNNSTFKQNIEKQLLVLNKDNKVQKAWIETRLGREVPTDWDTMTTKEKRQEVTNILVGDTIEKLKGTLKSRNGESFEEKTTLMDREEASKPKGLTADEKKDMSNIENAKIIANDIKRDPRLKFDYESLSNLATEYNLSVFESGTKEQIEDNSFSEIVIKGDGGVQATILKTDTPDDIARKIIRTAVPKLGEKNYKKVFEEIGKLKPTEGLVPFLKRNKVTPTKNWTSKSGFTKG
jgi:hypothetical protein